MWTVVAIMEGPRGRAPNRLGGEIRGTFRDLGGRQIRGDLQAAKKAMMEVGVGSRSCRRRGRCKAIFKPCASPDSARLPQDCDRD